MATTPTDAATGADVLLSMLADGPATEAPGSALKLVLNGPESGRR